MWSTEIDIQWLCILKLRHILDFILFALEFERCIIVKNIAELSLNEESE